MPRQKKLIFAATFVLVLLTAVAVFLFFRLRTKKNIYTVSLPVGDCFVNVTSTSEVLDIQVTDEVKFGEFVQKYLPCTNGKFVVGDLYDPELAPHEFGG